MWLKSLLEEWRRLLVPDRPFCWLRKKYGTYNFLIKLTLNVLNVLDLKKTWLGAGFSKALICICQMPRSGSRSDSVNLDPNAGIALPFYFSVKVSLCEHFCTTPKKFFGGNW
jgi:hypothetical protein